MKTSPHPAHKQTICAVGSIAPHFWQLLLSFFICLVNQNTLNTIHFVFQTSLCQWKCSRQMLFTRLQLCYRQRTVFGLNTSCISTPKCLFLRTTEVKVVKLIAGSKVSCDKEQPVTICRFLSFLL